MTSEQGEFNQQATPGDAGERTVVFDTPIEAVADDAFAAQKKHHSWPWITLVVVLLALAGACGGAYWFFQSHALPGTTLWGNSMVGKSQRQIADIIDNQIDNTTVTAAYDGSESKFTLSDLGISVDSDAIASDVVNAKRDNAVWQRYAFWIKKDIAPTIDPAVADGTKIDKALDITVKQPVDAQVKLNADGNGFEVVPGQQGEGADAKAVAQSAITAVQTLGGEPAKNVNVQLKTTDPKITEAIANEAKSTLDKLVEAKISVTIGDHAVATFDAPAIAAAMTIDPNMQSKLTDNQTRNGYVVFDSDKIQDYYNTSMKPNLKTDREDRKVIVDNSGKEIKVESEGHDGVTVADGADANIGPSVVQALAKGSGKVEVEGKVDPMKTQTVKRHVVVDLSDGKVYAYENDNLIKAMSMSAGEGNIRGTGACTGDLCTPTGDFTIWLKYLSQDMSGNVTLSDGSRSKWDVKDVGFVNYFSKTGCAIHRIVSPMTDAQIAAMNANTSHGCVGIGWDVAEWFYGWCLDGTSVHVQA